MGDVGIESTLVLDGLAVSKVRFYSTLDSDVGKRIEITDKFNPLNVFTGTFDESLNLLYDLPAFTSYRVKMYGLDGETVESDQTFMLKGYDYLEKNVGLNKNSFAGIKAIVDQGLENDLLEVGHTWREDDGGNASGLPVDWQILAINYQPQGEGYRHNVIVRRKRVLDIYSVFRQNNSGELETTYYNSLPSTIKEAIALRNIYSCSYSGSGGGTRTETNFKAHVWIVDSSEIVPNGAVANANCKSGSFNRYTTFPAYATASNRVFLKPREDLVIDTLWTRSRLQDSNSAPVQLSSNSLLYYTNSDSSTFYYAPHMMIASDPIV